MPAAIAVRITLIHNPGAGRQDGDGGAKLVHMLEGFGYRVRYQSAKEKSWKEALEPPADLVAVAGGDGTVARVARTMVGRGVPMGLLPSGTANNIARTLGVLERPFEELVRGWRDGRRVKLDAGVVSGPWGERSFIEGVGCGLFADLLTRPSPEAKNGSKPVENALERLRAAAERCQPIDLHARLDGRDISGRYLMAEALNLSYVGPNLHLAPESTPGDGHFDLVLVGEAERDRLVHYLEHWQENRERLAVLPTLRGRRLELEWAGFALHVDDELHPQEDAGQDGCSGRFEARIDPDDAVTFLVPA